MSRWLETGVTSGAAVPRRQATPARFWSRGCRPAPLTSQACSPTSRLSLQRREQARSTDSLVRDSRLRDHECPPRELHRQGRQGGVTHDADTHAPPDDGDRRHGDERDGPSGDPVRRVWIVPIPNEAHPHHYKRPPPHESAPERPRREPAELRPPAEFLRRHVRRWCCRQGTHMISLAAKCSSVASCSSG